MNDDRRRIQLKPYAPPFWSAAAMRFNNLLINKSQPVIFQVTEQDLMQIRLLPGNPHQQALYPLSLTLGVGDTTVGLWLSDWPLIDNIRAFIPEAMLARLPENLGIALIENALDPLFNIVERALSTKLRIQSLSADQNSQLYTLPLAFELAERKLPVSSDNNTASIRVTGGVLMLEERLYPLLQEKMREWPSDNNDIAGQKIDTEAHLEIGSSFLSINEINTITVSDVILLDDSNFHTDGELRLRFNSNFYLGARIELNPRRTLIITTGWINMADQEHKQNENQVNQIPVQLSFDLGQKSLSFSEVKQLRPGYVIDLSQALPEVVQIRAQNKLIGTGELVDVSGRIGVRILSLFGTRSKTG